MEQKVILITGASGGMGGELAKQFAKLDVKLALHFNTNPISIPENNSISHFQGNLASKKYCSQLIQDVVKQFGKIDVLINNAGISNSAMSWKTSENDWSDTMAINLNAPFYLSQSAIPIMRNSNWGRIINITSIVAQTGFIGTSAYTASKAGLIGLTKTLSKELASSGITVNSLALGYFNTGMIEDVPADIKKEIIESIPAKKLGEPETVFKAIQLLISSEGGYITGQTLNLNGGLFS